jgi:transcriptional regulator with XRE-family HTH domain
MNPPMSDDRDLIRAFLDAASAKPGVLQQPEQPEDSLLRRIRVRNGKTQKELAKALNLSAQAIASAESHEAQGSIKLETLARRADALGYALIYTLVPKAMLTEATGLTPIDPNRESAERAAYRQDNPLVSAILQMIGQAEAGEASLDPLIYDNVYVPAKS